MKKLILILIVILGLLQTEKASAYNSLIEYETQNTYSGAWDFLTKAIPDFLECIALQSIINTSQLNNNCIPRLINADPNFDQDCKDSINPDIGTLQTSATVITLLSTTAFFFFTKGWWKLISVGAISVAIPSLSPCFSSYLLAPHEYVNAILGYVDCQKIGDSVVNLHDKALTNFDVPFFYNCLDEPVPGNLSVSDTALLDKHYGNMNQAGSPYCQGPAAQFAINNIAKRGDINPDAVSGVALSQVKPGSIIVGSATDLWQALLDPLGLFNSKNPYCNLSSNTQLVIFTREEIMKGTQKDIKIGVFPGEVLGYFRLNAATIQLCAASTSPMLFRIGCNFIAPPIEQTQINIAQAGGTRCEYFLGSRSDLQSLGRAINQVRKGDDNSLAFSPVALFLMGDLHVISTVVGCLQDLLVKIVSGSSDDNLENSFLAQVQRAFANIVKVMLIIYISVIGFKIMTSPQAPQMGEVAMYVIKFAAVFAFSGPLIWIGTNDDRNSGLYTMIIEATNGLSNKVAQTTNNLSPVPMCYYDYGNGQNLLSEREVSQNSYPSLEATKSFMSKDPTSVKLTLWDYIDCKIVNYLNFNSCKFTLGNIMVLWLGTFFVFNIQTIIVGFLMLIFAVVIFVNLLKFVHLTIISVFAITVLILISPIMITFALFEYTKQTFQTWLKMLLGYIFYPALLLSFIAVMIATFDRVFYGQPVNNDCTKTANCTIKDICGQSLSENDSLYCAISGKLDKKITNLEANLCSVRNGQLTSLFNVSGFTDMFTGDYWNKTSDIFSELLSPLVRIVLFAILFHNMMGGITNFFEGLLGVYGISQQALSGSAIGRKMFSGALAITTKSAQGTGKAAQSIAKAIGKVKNRNNP
jgi:type IV secretion system protein VirB6